MKKFLLYIVTALLFLFGFVSLASPAQAAEEPPGYVLAAWVIPGGDVNDVWAQPQTLATSVATTDPSLDQLDSQLTCGTTYQIDRYYDNETTASLIAGAVLYGPGNPPEALAYVGEGNPWKYVTTPACVVQQHVTQCESPSATVHTTDLATWDLSETRANGHLELTSAGLHVFTDTDVTGSPDPRKAAAYFATDFPLADAGSPSLDWAGTSPAPGLQLVVDLDNDGTPNGILVGEAVYGGDWWTNAAVTAPQSGGGFGSDKHGTLDEWLTLYPSARVLAVGFSLGSGVNGDGVISGAVIGCTAYTFGLPAVVETLAPTPTPTAVPADVVPASADAALAETGFDGVPFVWVAAIILILGLGAVVASVIFRRREQRK